MKKQASAPATSRSISEDLRSRCIPLFWSAGSCDNPRWQNAIILRYACRWSRERRSTAPGNFPKPSQAKCHFTADGAGAFKKRDIAPATKEEERHVMDNSETRRDLHRPRDQRVPAGRILIPARLRRSGMGRLAALVRGSAAGGGFP